MTVRIALLSTALALTALTVPAAATAAVAPTAMQTVTTGKLGSWAYSVRFGEGVADDGGGRGFCSDLVADNLMDPVPEMHTPRCDAYAQHRPARRELLPLASTHHGSEDGTEILIDTWVTRPRVQRLKISYAGGGRQVITRATGSKVLSLYGDRARYWFRVLPGLEVQQSIVGQRRACREVGGIRRCGWRTIATPA